MEDAAAALAGARDILAERLAENAAERAELRRVLAAEGLLRVRVLPEKEKDPEAATYRDYFEHDEPGRDIPSHRLLAILRGEREGFLISDLRVDDEREVERLGRSWRLPLDTACGREIAEATADGYKRLLRPSITNEVRSEMRERAEAQAIAVFRANLEALLLQAPLGPGAGDGARSRLPHRLQARRGGRHRPRGGDRRHPRRAAARRTRSARRGPSSR